MSRKSEVDVEVLVAKYLLSFSDDRVCELRMEFADRVRLSRRGLD